jgi:hypothetical protein
MGANRTGCARGRPVPGEELAALQRGEDIAQSNVTRRPRQFETASRTEPSANQPALVISEKSRRTTTGLVLALSATSSERTTLPGLAARAVSK